MLWGGAGNGKGMCGENLVISRSLWLSASMKPTTTTTGKSFILYDAEALDQADDPLFESSFWAEHGTALKAAAGRGSAIFVRHGEVEWVVRHYRRGGLVARLSRDRYLWNGLARSRPWREWHLLATLNARGLPVPRPVAARVTRTACLYRGDLITVRIPGRPLSEWLSDGPIPLERWEAIGRCLRRFHKAGACHADLNAHNILIDDGGDVYLIDFDRGTLRRPGRWSRGNLARLRHSLRRLQAGRPGFSFREGDWSALLAAYAR